MKYIERNGVCGWCFRHNLLVRLAKLKWTDGNGDFKKNCSEYWICDSCRIVLMGLFKYIEPKSAGG